MRHFLTINDLSKEELHELLEDAITMKQEVKDGIPHPHLAGQTLGMIFEKSSTRTRVSFEVGMYQLGGHALFLSANDIQLGRGETVADTAKVMSRYVDGMMIRTFGHAKIEEFAANATVPIINGLTNEHHPTQVLADLMTIKEHKGELKGLKVAFIGDGNNNMTHSLIQGAVNADMSIIVASPKGYEPDQDIVDEAATEGSVSFTYDPKEAVKDADIIITDVWASMGDEAEIETRLQTFKDYQVNSDLVDYAQRDYLFLHCLPAHRGEEVTADIIDGPHSVVFDEAENRLHAQKALLKKLLKK
ncbi:ornithine carbamoyltransferase [Paenalkalicoccus suaedae]|uniref:Ornithine carbamoyltransferase n=1 Tax=Paenalkalicoccus suaedae TaxID=2592382 RepID=A0A859FEF7_9BACI|nr:ornithine carbamoyltransferase [Paenalkalicoccus suaedae]QKS71228.1 ornithine carbamoyltransferase [Paenalkalicoccus suaedae]